MGEPTSKRATYEDLFSLPEDVTGEIIDGELIVTPKPAPRHAGAGFVLSHEIGSPYQFGQGGPGGWIFLPEVEIMFGEDLLVPDISGWRKERFPGHPKENWFSVAPDWICEILSPSTRRKDRILKMRIYAREHVSWVWLVDPLQKLLDVFRLEPVGWVLASSFVEDDKVRAEPFDAIEFDLGGLWMD